MYYLTLIEILGVSAVSAFLIHSYCAKEINLLVKGMALVSWLINFVMLILVPLDIYITYRDDKGEPSSAYYNLSITYQILYWGNFFLCWTVIPIMQEYEDAVDLDRNDKLKRAFRNNIQFYVVIGIVGVIFIVCIALTGTAKQYGLGTFLKSMANSFGGLLIVILLGYALVTIPRAHMRTAQLDLQMKYLYFRTATITTEKQDAHHDLEETAKQVIAVKDFKYDDDRFNIYIKKCIDKIPQKMLKKLINEEKGKRQSFIHSLGAPQLQHRPLEIQEMIDLYQRVRRAVQAYKRVKASWKENCKRAFEMEDILQSQSSEKKKIEWSFKKPKTGRFAKELTEFEWYWLTDYKPRYKIVLSISLGLMSILVLISELTLFMDTHFTIFGLPLKLVHSTLAIQIFSFVPLLYIAFCVYYGMFRIKIAGYQFILLRFYGLYGDHQTDAPSLMFATINFSRVGAPLCQNFLNMLRLDRETAFNYAMGHIELIPIFGISITALLPCLLLILCIVNYFDLLDRLMNFIGMKQFVFAASFSDRLIYEGRDALKITRRKYQKTKELQVCDGTGGNLDRLL